MKWNKYKNGFRSANQDRGLGYFKQISTTIKKNGQSSIIRVAKTIRDLGDEMDIKITKKDSYDIARKMTNGDVK